MEPILPLDFQDGDVQKFFCKDMTKSDFLWIVFTEIFGDSQISQGFTKTVRA